MMKTNVSKNHSQWLVTIDNGKNYCKCKVLENKSIKSKNYFRLPQ